MATRAEGNVLEIGIGTGRNIGLYPSNIQLTGVDVSVAMLEQAHARAQGLGRVVGLRLGDAQRLDLPDESFDTVVSTLSLCSIPDDRKAISEVARVLRAGGRLVVLEHVASPRRPVRAAQQVLNPLFVRAMADHLLREPAAGVVEAGLVVVERQQARLGIVERLVARKPTAAD